MGAQERRQPRMGEGRVMNDLFRCDKCGFGTSDAGLMQAHTCPLMYGAIRLPGEGWKAATEPYKQPSILDEAARIVNGDRQQSYGHPRDNHGCTAELWTAYFRRCGLLRDDVTITPRQVCIANILQKASRDAEAPKRDNLTDIAGYAANAELAS